MQDHNIRVSNQSKVEYNNIKFDSKMEVKFYKFLQENNIEFEYQPNIHFEYYDFKNIKHIYEPDFKIGDKIYELKGTHFFKNGDINDVMINPFKRNDLPENVLYRDNIMESKHQCMLKNNVIIITDLKNIKKEDFED